MEKETYRIFFENCPEALLAVRDGRIEAANEEAGRLLGGCAPAELQGRRLEEVVPMDMSNHNGLHSSLGRLAAGDVRSYDWDLILPGPVYIPVRIRAAGLPGDTVLLSIRDRTGSRDRTRAFLEAEEQRLALIEASPSPVFCVDKDLRIQWASRSFVRKAGLPESTSVRGSKCFSLLLGYEAPCRGCPAAISMMTRMPATLSVSCGGEEWDEAASALRDSEGAPTGALIFLVGKGASEAPAAQAFRFSQAPVSSGGAVSDLAAPMRAEVPDEPRLLDVAGLLRLSTGELRGALGNSIEVLQQSPSAPVATSADQILGTIRKLAEADFGSCLDTGRCVLLRVDPATVRPGLPGGLPGGRYVSISVGNLETLGSATLEQIASCASSFISSFPMGSATRSAKASGAVFVSRIGDNGRFYQILLSEAGRPGGGQ